MAKLVYLFVMEQINHEMFVVKHQSHFPSREHELAFTIAEYFGEKYGYWVNQILKSKLTTSYIEREFKNLQQRQIGMKDKARIMMSVVTDTLSTV